MKDKCIGFDISGDKNGEPECDNRSKLIFQSDSGRGLSIEDLKHHLIFMGTTGSGKSTNGMLPCVDQLIKDGHCGAVIAVKSGLCAQIKSLAARNGRLDDIMEIGTTADATPVNILASMTSNEIYQFFDAIVYENIRGMSHNYDFHAKGIRLVTDCAYLLSKLNAVNPDIVPNILTITEMLSDYVSAARLWQYYKKFVYRPSDPEEVRFVHGVETNPFHLLMESLEETERSKRRVNDTSRNEQLAYATGAIRGALRTFLDVPGIIDKFCDPQASGVNMEPMIKEGKIVVIQINPEYGPLGSTIARFVLKRVYQAIIKHGKELPPGKKAFVAIDEFQEVADLSPAQYSDSSFIAMAREYNGIFMAATQSLSALMAKGENYAAVDSFVSNCNSRCMFYSDDPLTQNMAARHNPELTLIDLKPGEAFMVTYNDDTREHSAGVETFQNAFEHTREILENTAIPDKPMEISDKVKPSLIEMAKWAVMETNAKMTKTDTPREAPARHEKPNVEIQINGNAVKVEKKLPTQKTMTLEIQKRHPLVKKFPQFFAQGNVYIEIPTGWIKVVEQILLAYARTGLPVTIGSLSIRNGRLVAREAGENNPMAKGSGLAILNSMLRLTRNACMICGSTLPEEDDEPMPVCDACLEEFQLPVNHVKKEEHDEND